MKDSLEVATHNAEIDLAESMVGRAFTPVNGDTQFELIAIGSVANAEPDQDRWFVQWRWAGRHTGSGHFARTEATNFEVKIEGTTLVDISDRENPTFLRFIDWSQVMAQVGVFPSRQILLKRGEDFDARQEAWRHGRLAERSLRAGESSHDGIKRSKDSHHDSQRYVPRPDHGETLSFDEDGKLQHR